MAGATLTFNFPGAYGGRVKLTNASGSMLGQSISLSISYGTPADTQYVNYSGGSIAFFPGGNGISGLMTRSLTEQSVSPLGFCDMLNQACVSDGTDIVATMLADWTSWPYVDGTTATGTFVATFTDGSIIQIDATSLDVGSSGATELASMAPFDVGPGGPAGWSVLAGMGYDSTLTSDVLTTALQGANSACLLINEGDGPTVGPVVSWVYTPTSAGSDPGWVGPTGTFAIGTFAAAGSATPKAPSPVTIPGAGFGAGYD